MYIHNINASSNANLMLKITEHSIDGTVSYFIPESVVTYYIKINTAVLLYDVLQQTLIVVGAGLSSWVVTEYLRFACLSFFKLIICVKFWQ